MILYAYAGGPSNREGHKGDWEISFYDDYTSGTRRLEFCNMFPLFESLMMYMGARGYIYAGYAPLTNNSGHTSDLGHYVFYKS